MQQQIPHPVHWETPLSAADTSGSVRHSTTPTPSPAAPAHSRPAPRATTPPPPRAESNFEFSPYISQWYFLPAHMLQIRRGIQTQMVSHRTVESTAPIASSRGRF